MSAEPINPDCQVGKHQACSGTAWDDVLDDLTDCVCSCHEPMAPLGDVLRDIAHGRLTAPRFATVVSVEPRVLEALAIRADALEEEP